MNSITRLNAKVIGIWAGLGAILGVLIAISALSSGSVQFGDALSIFLQGSLVFLVNGFFYYALDGVFRYKFRFDRIFYPLWVWAIYPVLGALVLGLSIAAGVLAVIGIRLPLPKADNQDIEEKLLNSTPREILPEIEKALASRKFELTDEENRVVSKIRKLIDSTKKIKDILSKEELNIYLILFVVKILGLKIRRKLQ